jgi:hypothetical protein
LVLLLVRGGATNATDTYFYLFSLGLTPVLILVVGVMGPLLLNSQTLSKRGLQIIHFGAPTCAAFAVMGGYAWLRTHRQMEDELLSIALIMSLNAVLQGLLYYRAVAAEASGNASWSAGIAFPANAAACLALAWPWSTSITATLAMVSALAVGNAGLLIEIHRRHVGADVLAAITVEKTRHRGALWFLGRASVGYTGHLVLSTLAVTLPASSVTILSLASKIVGAISTTLTNAVLPVLIHRATETYAGARRFLRLLVASLSAVGFVATVAVAVTNTRYAMAVLVISLWTITSSGAAVAQRTAFRFLPARAAGNVIAAVLLITGVTVALAGMPGFDVTVLLCGYASLDAAAAMLLLWSLRDRVASSVAALMLAVLLGLAGVTLF